MSSLSLAVTPRHPQDEHRASPNCLQLCCCEQPSSRSLRVLLPWSLFWVILEGVQFLSAQTTGLELPGS